MCSGYAIVFQRLAKELFVSQRRRSLWTALSVLLAMALPAMLPVAAPTVFAAPITVTLAGSLQSEAGCAGDWDPACTSTHMVYDANDDVWQLSVALPAGNYEYKAALNDNWNENYGAQAGLNGANIALNLAAPTTVKFYYDDKTHWITSNTNRRIVVAPGSFQSELGCSGDWDPSCLRSWLQDIDGDGIYTFETTALPAGTYDGKIAINESWDENYGVNGVRDGGNLTFVVPNTGAKVKFSFVSATNTLSIQAGHGADNNVEWDGVRHDSRDTLYRTPAGAVKAGTSVTLRLRTYHNDATSVKLRLYDINANGQRIVPMAPAATDVPCFQNGLEAESCDFWETSITQSTPKIGRASCRERVSVLV